jgi:hypothetical protein
VWISSHFVFILCPFIDNYLIITVAPFSFNEFDEVLSESKLSSHSHIRLLSMLCGYKCLHGQVKIFLIHFDKQTPEKVLQGLVMSK